MHFPMPDGEPCFFCEISDGNIHEWQVIAEDELTMTLLNGRQFETGQCLVIPRRHAGPEFVREVEPFSCHLASFVLNHGCHGSAIRSIRRFGLASV